MVYSHDMQLKYCHLILTAPLTETIDHFWRMIKEYGVKAIVMLTKCIELSRVSQIMIPTVI